MVLTGAAGTGKSTLVAVLVQEALLQRWRVVVTAPTGRAAWLLKQRLGHADLEVGTLHRFLYAAEGMEEVEDPEYGDLPLFRFALKPGREEARTLLVVDEASMVGELESTNPGLRFGSGSLLKDLVAWLRSCRGEAKVLLVGDPCQLPPVTECQSPALEAAHLEAEYGLATRTAGLREVMRQAGSSPILALATAFRKCLEENRPLDGRLPAGDDLQALPRALVLGRYCELARRHGEASVVLLARTNNLV